MFFSEPVSRRVLKMRELLACFFEGLSNPLGVSIERFFGFLAVRPQMSGSRQKIAVSTRRHGILREVNEGLSMLYVRSSGWFKNAMIMEAANRDIGAMRGDDNGTLTCLRRQLAIARCLGSASPFGHSFGLK